MTILYFSFHWSPIILHKKFQFISSNIEGVMKILVINTLTFQYRPKGPQVEAEGHLRAFWPIAGARKRDMQHPKSFSVLHSWNFSGFQTRMFCVIFFTHCSSFLETFSQFLLVGNYSYFLCDSRNVFFVRKVNMKLDLPGNQQITEGGRHLFSYSHNSV